VLNAHDYTYISYHAAHMIQASLSWTTTRSRSYFSTITDQTSHVSLLLLCAANTSASLTHEGILSIACEHVC
jgi:hypothetical protein